MMNEHDSLDDVLAAPNREMPAAMREALRQRTAGVVRWRRYRRRAVQTIIAGQGLLAVGVIAWMLAAGILSWQPAESDQHAVQPLENRPDLKPTPKIAEPANAVALEWKAFDAPAADQPALYFLAGQRYFDEHNDLESALRCYREAFRSGSEELLTVTPNDNWLVMAIKIDCRKEN